jgi:pyruvate dehydrogenase E2 component (dihydrolipoamide acetyltransferase)
MADKIIMPQGGQDLQFGTVVRWLRKEGEAVKKDDLLCEVETEKAVFEVPAPRDGVLLRILKQAGEEAEVLSAIGFVGDAGEVVDLPHPEAAERELPEQEPAGGARPAARLTGEKMRISPKARKLARDNGIDFTQLTSNRPDGKITTEIVQQAIMYSGEQEMRSTVSGGRLEKIGRVQRTAAARLSRSWQTAPHFFVTVSVDMTNLMQAREEFNRYAGDKKISINDFILKAAAGALTAFPEVNATYRDAETIIIWDDIHIGIATASGDGLLVPVLENADALSLAEIAEKTQSLTQNARQGRVSADVQSHFTISNLGMHQVDQFTAIINPPESAILAVASIQKKAVVDSSGAIVVRDMMEMTLSLDHRIGDGVLAAQFINHIKALLETPRKLWHQNQE